MCSLGCDRPVIWLTGCGASRLRLWRARVVVVSRRSFYSRGWTFLCLLGPPKGDCERPWRTSSWTWRGWPWMLVNSSTGPCRYSKHRKCTGYETRGWNKRRRLNLCVVASHWIVICPDNVMDFTKWAADCCHSTPGRLSARRTRRCWTPAWRCSWPGQTQPRPGRTRLSPRLRFYCNPAQVRQTKQYLDFVFCAFFVVFC